jgi:hypothetical protein
MRNFLSTGQPEDFAMAACMVTPAEAATEAEHTRFASRWSLVFSIRGDRETDGLERTALRLEQ